MCRTDWIILGSSNRIILEQFILNINNGRAAVVYEVKGHIEPHTPVNHRDQIYTLQSTSFQRFVTLF